MVVFYFILENDFFFDAFFAEIIFNIHSLINVSVGYCAVALLFQFGALVGKLG